MTLYDPTAKYGFKEAINICFTKTENSNLSRALIMNIVMTDPVILHSVVYMLLDEYITVRNELNNTINVWADESTPTTLKILQYMTTSPEKVWRITKKYQPEIHLELLRRRNRKIQRLNLCFKDILGVIFTCNEKAIHAKGIVLGIAKPISAYEYLMTKDFKLKRELFYMIDRL